MTDLMPTDLPGPDAPQPKEGDASRSVVTECDLPDAPDKVWRALTAPKLLAQWLPEAANSEILAAQPNRLLRYRWSGTEQDRDAAGQRLESEVTFELEGTPGGGTHLRVEHRVLARANVIPFVPRRTVTSGGSTTACLLRRAA